MKKFYILFAILIPVLAEAQNYNFINSTATYNNLTGAISLNNGEVWDDPEYTISLPFSIAINGIFTNTLVVSDSFIFVNDDPAVRQIISPSGMDLIDRGSSGDNSLSPLSYKIDGVVGSRIAKVEYNNVGSIEDFALTMFMNFQIWFYETTNIIEIRFGSSFVPDPMTFYQGFSGGVVGITNLDNDTEEFTDTIFLMDSPEAPTPIAQLAFLDGTPSTGRMYRFIPTNLGQEQFAGTSINIYPNPADEVLTVSGLTDTTSYNLYNATGKLLNTGQLSEIENKVDVSQLSAGLYLIQFGESSAVKFLKR